MQSYTVQPLVQSQFHAAYPLMREAVPTLDLSAWSRFARRFADPRRASRSGIMVAQRRSRPYPSGLFCYHKEVDLQYGLLLTVDHFVALDIIDHQSVANALIAALEPLGRRLQCDAIRSLMHVGSQDVAPNLFAAGFRQDGAVLCKRLEGGGRNEHVEPARSFENRPSTARR